MWASLLPLLRCPECGGSLDLEAYESADNGSSNRETLAGELTCVSSHRYPVIEGIPRLLHKNLLAGVLTRHRDFCDRYGYKIPEVAADDRADPLLATLKSFSRQRRILTTETEYSKQWIDHFRQKMAPVEPASLTDKLVLDAGCGFGRHLFACSQFAACVGVDISSGVENAARINKGNERVHIIQGDLYNVPLAAEFDWAYSIGVIHHTPDPAGAVASIASRLKAGAGLTLWLYGYEGMKLTYRVSHMRRLRKLLDLSSDAQVLTATLAVSVALDLLYLRPLDLMTRVPGLRGLRERLPLSPYFDFSFRNRFAAVHDRISTPITVYPEPKEIASWYAAAGCEVSEIFTPDRRGWNALGYKRLS